MMKNDLDAVKLLADWSKWLASLQTAIITLIGLATASGSVSISRTIQPSWVLAAVIFFLISIFCASFILFSLPGIAQRLPPPEDRDIFSMGTYNGGGIKLVVFSVSQFVFFGSGTIFIVVWAVVQLISSCRC